MYETIEIELEGGAGAVSGYVTDADAENLGNWLVEYSSSASAIAQWAAM